MQLRRCLLQLQGRGQHVGDWLVVQAPAAAAALSDGQRLAQLQPWETAGLEVLLLLPPPPAQLLLRPLLTGKAPALLQVLHQALLHRLQLVTALAEMSVAWAPHA